MRVAFACGIEIAAPPARIHAELAAPERQLGLQPLLIEVVPLAAAPADPPGVRRFEAVERVPLFGRVALRNRIRVTVRPDPEGRFVDFHARSRGAVEVRSRFALEPCAGGTRVREDVALRVPRWLRRFVEPRAVAAQAALLANLKQRLEAEAARAASPEKTG
ncbi:MAG: hypothetical protein HKP30_17595 [Myxococcales bacterium]|nr:hypothetical protein [Myxococcales bacterium]